MGSSAVWGWWFCEGGAIKEGAVQGWCCLGVVLPGQWCCPGGGAVYGMVLNIGGAVQGGLVLSGGGEGVVLSITGSKTLPFPKLRLCAVINLSQK